MHELSMHVTAFYFILYSIFVLRGFFRLQCPIRQPKDTFSKAKS